MYTFIYRVFFYLSRVQKLCCPKRDTTLSGIARLYPLQPFRV